MIKSTELKITIASMGQRGTGLTQEINMIKSALLYADKVTVISPLASLFMPIDCLANSNIDEQLHAFFAMAEAADLINQEIEMVYLSYLVLAKKRRRTKQELLSFEKLRHSLKKAFDDKGFAQKAQQVADEAGAHHIRKAISQGIVEIHLLETYGNDITESYLSTVFGALLSGNSFPMLDRGTGLLIDSLFKLPLSFKLSDETVSRGKEVALNDALLSGLPEYPNATVDEVLDIRKELQKDLIRYRSALITFSEEIQALPWNDSFEAEAQRIYRKHVSPEIESISVSVANSTELRNLSRRLREDPVVLTSAIALVNSLVNGGPALVSQIAPAALAGSVLVDLFKTISDTRQVKREVRERPLYFLHKTDSLLANQKRKR